MNRRLCEQKKVSVEGAFDFYTFLVYLVLQHYVNLPLTLKIVVGYVTKDSAKLNPLQNKVVKYH